MFDRTQKVIWSDILMSQMHEGDFVYEAAKIAGPNSIAARPAVYKVTIAKSGDCTANDTVVIGGVTFTAKAEPSTSEGTTEFALDATAAEIAAIVKAKGLSNYTLTNDGAVVTYTQTTAGTGDAVTIGTGTGTKATATVVKYQDYKAGNSTDPIYSIEPGEPMKLVSTGTDGVKTVAPVDVTVSDDITAFIGFATERLTVNKGETIALTIATQGCKLCIDDLPEVDQFGNDISWAYADGSLRKAAEAKNFRFGKKGN